jgi:hypothetical protein
VLATRQFAARHSEFTRRGVELVRVFRSPVEALAGFARGPGAVPFAVVADPGRVAYRLFGVPTSLLALLRRGALARMREAAGAGLKPRWRDALRDGLGGCPADFLIGNDGRVVHARYGLHLADSLAPEAALRWIDAAAARGTLREGTAHDRSG